MSNSCGKYKREEKKPNDDEYTDDSSDEGDEDEIGEEVMKAHILNDPLELVNSFRSFNCKDGGTGTVQHYKVHELSSTLSEWMMDLMKRNMKTLYDQSWGWDPVKKKAEMTEKNSRYLIAFLRDKPVAFSHFQFDMDYGRQVVYCYEIQLETVVRGFGLGRHLMQTLEAITSATGLSMVVLTVLKNNSNAIAFFKGVGFKTDETCPLEEEKKDYFILSKQT